MADGRADALVSGGSTGAALAAGAAARSSARAGIYRPALAVPVPVPGNPVTLLDVGANAEVRPEHLVQFAYMGAALAQAVLGVERPRVGTAVQRRGGDQGHPARGRGPRRAHRAAAERASFEWVGNVEGTDLTIGRAPT